MKKCMNCGYEPLIDASRFCNRCGSESLSDATPPVQLELPPAKKKPGMLLSLLYAWLFTLLFNAVLSVTAVIYVVSLILVKGDPYASDTISIDASNIATIAGYLVFFAVVAVLFAARRKDPLKETAIRRFPPKLIPYAALFGYSANLVYSFAVGLIPWPQKLLDAHNKVYGDIGAESSSLVITILTIALFTGIAEELVFRGLVITRLQNAYGKAFSVIISALIFALAHTSLISFTYSFVLGLFLGMIFIRYRSVIPCMIAHIFFNLSACIGYPEADLLILGMLFICIALHVLSTYLIFKRDRGCGEALTDEVSAE